MKKCPTCEKTFEDSLRFCQTDGTPLVDDAPAIDPYATIVSSAVSDAPAEEMVESPAAEDVGIESVEAEPIPEARLSAIAEPDEVLDLPEPDPMKTMYVSEDEMRAVRCAGAGKGIGRSGVARADGRDKSG